jgi:hypothetical protein
MKRTPLVRILILLSLSLHALAGDPIEETRPSANRGLATFRKLVGADSYRAMGFSSLEEARTASALGEPMIVHTVAGQQLAAYESTRSTASLTGNVLRVVWPVMVGERVCSSITVARAKHGWKAVRFGWPNFSQQLVRVRLNQARLAGLPPASVSAMEVPVLQLWLVAYVRNGQLTLAALESRGALGLSSNEPIPAKAAFDTIFPSILHNEMISH